MHRTLWITSALAILPAYHIPSYSKTTSRVIITILSLVPSSHLSKQKFTASSYPQQKGFINGNIGFLVPWFWMETLILLSYIQFTIYIYIQCVGPFASMLFQRKPCVYLIMLPDPLSSSCLPLKILKFHKNYDIMILNDLHVSYWS